MPTIKSENWDGVTAPAIPSGWTVDTQLATTTTLSPTSTPNSLGYLTPNNAVVPYATWATQDTNSGDVQVSATIRLATTSVEQDIWLFGRCNVVAANANDGTHTNYNVIISRGSGSPGLFLNKKVAGTTTHLATVAGASIFADATNYRLYLRCRGSSISAQCQRLSDSFWLNSSGVFVSDPSGATTAATATDTAITGAGYAGIGTYLATSAGSIGLDDWLLESVVNATISASPARLVAGSGPQTVTLTGSGTAFSTSSSSQFTLSGGTGASIVSQSASTATAATLSINPGTASGTLTITDTTDGSITTTIAVQATYYVSPTGSDTNSGLSSAAPWQTIAKVNAQTLSSGDQVLLQGGQTHSGNLLIQNSGTVDFPISLSSYGTGQATINPGTGAGISVKDCEYVRLSNLIVLGPGVSVSGATSSSTSTGAGVEVLTTTTQASITSWRRGVYLDRLTVSGTYHGILVHNTAGSDSGPFPVGYSDLRITNCTVHDCLSVGIKVWSDTNFGTANYLVHKNVYIGACTVSNIYGDSAFLTSHTGNGILVGNVNVGLTERCLVANGGQANGSGSTGGPAGNWCYECTAYTIQYCETHHQHDAKAVDADGFDLDGGCQNCTVQYCYSHDNDGSGYIWGTYAGSAANTGNTFRYNVSQNDGRFISASGAHSFGSPVGTLVYNNTFYSGTPGTLPALLAQIGEGSFYNNIFWCGTGVNLMSAVSGGTFAGNLYWFGGNPFSVVYNGTTYSSLAAWRAVQETAGGVAVGLSADPQLAAPGTGGTLLPSAQVSTLGAYALGAGSPAVDAGLDLRTLYAIDPGQMDFSGHPVRAGAGYDVGATEYGAAALVGGSGGVRRVTLAGGIGG